MRIRNGGLNSGGVPTLPTIWLLFLSCSFVIIPDNQTLLGGFEILLDDGRVYEERQQHL